MILINKIPKPPEKSAYFSDILNNMKRDNGFNPQVLKYFRILKGLTQAELAKCLNTTMRTVQNWESGRTQPAKTKGTKGVSIHQIGEYFEVNWQVFFTRMKNLLKKLKRRFTSRI